MRIMTASKSSRAETRLSLSLYRSGPSGRGQPSFPQGPGLACLRRRAVSPSSGDFPRSPRSQNPTRTQTATTVPRTKRDFLNDGVDYVAAPRSGDRCTTRNMNRYGFTRQHTALRGHAQNVKGITAASGRDEQPRASRTSWTHTPSRTRAHLLDSVRTCPVLTRSQRGAAHFLGQNDIFIPPPPSPPAPAASSCSRASCSRSR